MVQVNGEVVCPRCGTRMEYRVEIEFGENGAKRIRYYYRCPRCGYRENDLVLMIRRDGAGKIVIEKEEYIKVAVAKTSSK